MKRTKHALLLSAVSMLLCLSMLIGSTFAWFTDTASTGVNKIVAGNLDVELEYYVNGTWEPVTEDTKLFSDFEKDGTTANLWEPGHTEYVKLRIRNAGSLALKYNFLVNVYGDKDGNTTEPEYTNVNDQEVKLSNFLVFNKIDNITVSSREACWIADAAEEKEAMGNPSAVNGNGTLLANSDPVVFTLAVYMPTTVGNEANQLTSDRTANGAPEIYLGITVNATQVENEEDSFGNDYDKDASLPSTNGGTVKPGEATVITSGAVTLEIPADAGLKAGGDEINEETEVILNVDPNAATPNLSLVDETVVKTFEISFVTKDGKAVTADNGINVTIKVGNINGSVRLYHNENPIGISGYNRATGEIAFTTNSFSPFTVTEKAPTKVNSTEEVTAAITNAKPGEVIKVDATEVEINSVKEGVAIQGNGAENTTVNVPATTSGSRTTGLVINEPSVTISDVTLSENTSISSDEYAAVAAVSKGDVTFDGVKVTATGYTSALVIDRFQEGTVTIANSIINGGWKAIHIADGANGKIVIDNTVITAIYPFNVNSASSKDLEIEVIDSKLYGWTSYGDIKSATFTNTTFGKGNGYAFIRPYTSSTFTGCEFNLGFEVGSGADNLIYEFNNCTINGVALTAENIADLIDETDPGFETLTVKINGVEVTRS